ncbi:MAG TPA: hypothetical protein VNM67_17825 [Thermoanaerobaculia bacterium]|jgi:hypothetical protein|nr:hypothetical protein [Thermoanaerobaculia bacterium]
MTPPPPDEEVTAPAPESTISREKEKLWVTPSRGMIAWPGTSLVFGRGFFRRFRKLGTRAWLFLGFLTIGMAIFLVGLAGTIGPFKEGLSDSGQPTTFHGAMAVGIVLILMALRMLQVALADTGRSELPPNKERKAPWTWDYPWSKDWMRPDYGEHVGDTLLGRVMFFAMVALANAAWLTGEGCIHAILVVLDLVALLVLYNTLHRAFQSVRFRTPVVIWEEIPVFPGNLLQGRIAFPRDLRAMGPTRLSLRCVRDEKVSEGGPANHQPCAIYQEIRKIPLPGEPGEPLDVLSFSFKVPGDMPGTNLVKNEPVYWQVVLSVPVSGPDLEAAFLAPIYQRNRA